MTISGFEIHVFINYLDFQINSSLQALYVAWNGFSNCGCREIGTALQGNTALEVLDLSNNRIGLEGAKWLAKGLLVNSKLRHLKVSCHEYKNMQVHFPPENERIFVNNFMIWFFFSFFKNDGC